MATAMRRVVGALAVSAAVWVVATSEPAHAQIKILSGTYGQNCGAPTGNWTAKLAGTCDTLTTCRFDIDPHPDPCYGTKKTFIADYSCQPDTTRLRKTVEAPAESQPFVLTCQAAAAPPEILVATIRTLKGEVLVAPRNQDYRPAAVGQRLIKGDTIQTGPDSKAVLDFVGGATMTIPELAELSVGELATSAGRTRIVMLIKIGEVNAKIQRQQAVQSDFSIKTPTAHASVRGTAFTVRYDPRTTVTTVRVDEGEVLVTPTNTGLRPIVLAAGQQVDVMPSRIGQVTAAGAPSSGVVREQFGWVGVGTGDCTGRDTGQTGGSPVPGADRCSIATQGTIAVCWDGRQLANGGPQPWCTYKSTAARLCQGGARPGFVYECRAGAATLPQTTAQTTPPAPPGSSTAPQGCPLAGTWYYKGDRNQRPSSIERRGDALRIDNGQGSVSKGRLQGGTLIADDWGLTATFAENGCRLNWSNGTWWLGYR